MRRQVQRTQDLALESVLKFVDTYALWDHAFKARVNNCVTYRDGAKLQRTPMLLIGHPPDASEPHPQGKVASVEDRACNHGRLVSAARTHRQASFRCPTAPGATAWTAKARRPSQLHQVGVACGFRCEALFKFIECSGVVVHEPRHYRLWRLESSG